MPFTARVSAVADDRRVSGESGGKLRRRLAFQPSQIGTREMREHAVLQFADHQQHDLLHLDVLEILRERLDRRDGHDQRRYLIENAAIVFSEHLERVVDHHRI